MLYNADCLDIMRGMPDKCVDLMVNDLPFGMTQNQWDIPLPIDLLWEQILRIKKENTAIIFFGCGMFTAELMESNKRLWRYNLIWEKGERATGFLNSHKMPLRSHEDIIVFYSSLPTYNPQFTRGDPTHRRDCSDRKNSTYGKFKEDNQRNYGFQKFPKSVLKFDKPHPPIHPSEKPVDLLECLINTYSNPGDVVLDFCMGSGSTGVACIHTGRQFIGVEKEKVYFDAGKARIEDAMRQEKLNSWGLVEI